MRILGNRVLVSKIEEEKQPAGTFQAVEVTDKFTYKGRIEQLGDGFLVTKSELHIGQEVIFAKYSPTTHSIKLENDSREMKMIEVEDILMVI